MPFSTKFCYYVRMATTIKNLLSSDPDDLQALLDEINKLREQEQLVAHERELAERVVEMIIEAGGSGAKWLTDPARGLLTIGPLRSQIERVLAAGPADREWAPREVHEVLAEHGNTTVKLDNIRVTMVRMAAGGQLKQEIPEVLSFRLPKKDPPSEGAHDDT
jgi:hypothetical protein